MGMTTGNLYKSISVYILYLYPKSNGAQPSYFIVLGDSQLNTALNLLTVSLYNSLRSLSVKSNPICLVETDMCWFLYYLLIFDHSKCSLFIKGRCNPVT